MRTKWTPERLAAVADNYPLPGIRLRYKRRVRRGGKLVRKYTPCHAVLYDEYVLLPKADTITGLYFNLHERAHLILRHFNECDARTKKLADMYAGNGQLTEAEQEYQAEQWAFATMQRHGVPVSKRLRDMARRYVLECMDCDARRGDGKPPHHIRRWVRKR